MKLKDTEFSDISPRGTIVGELNIFKFVDSDSHKFIRTSKYAIRYYDGGKLGDHLQYEDGMLEREVEMC